MSPWLNNRVKTVRGKKAAFTNWKSNPAEEKRKVHELRASGMCSHADIAAFHIHFLSSGFLHWAHHCSI